MWADNPFGVLPCWCILGEEPLLLSRKFCNVWVYNFAHLLIFILYLWRLLLFPDWRAGVNFSVLTAWFVNAVGNINTWNILWDVTPCIRGLQQALLNYSLETIELEYLAPQLSNFAPYCTRDNCCWPYIALRQNQALLSLCGTVILRIPWCALMTEEALSSLSSVRVRRSLTFTDPHILESPLIYGLSYYRHHIPFSSSWWVLTLVDIILVDI